jgi:DNA-binding SARP family transcriptional activator
MQHTYERTLRANAETAISFAGSYRTFSIAGETPILPTPTSSVVRGKQNDAALERMISIRTLGPVEITVGGAQAPPELLWRKHLALLIYLARSPQYTRSREHLVGLLWAEKAESAARHSLREAIRVLRRAAGESAIDTRGDQVLLARDRFLLDLNSFDGAAEREAWSEVAPLIGGEFLEGFHVPDAPAFEDWLSAERRSWMSRSVDALRRYGESLLDSGRLGIAAEVANRILQLDGSATAGARLAVRCAALGGEVHAALDVYREFVERLRDSTGTDPSRELQDLADRVRRGRMPSAEVKDAVAAVRRAPLIGRALELEQLCQVWNTVRSGGKAAIATIEADLGLGKSRLLDELAGRAVLDGAAVSVVRCVQADYDDPWSGLLGLAGGGLLDAPGLAGAKPEAIDAFAAHLPAWTERFGSHRQVGGMSQGRAFRDLLAAVAEEGPVMLAADDAQWLDQDSLLTLDALLRDLGEGRVLVAFGFTPQPARDLLDELRSRIGRELQGAAINLAPLADSHVRELADWALPEYDSREIDRVARRVVVDSAGLPLLAIELLHAITLGLELRGPEAEAWPAPFRTLSQTLPSDLPDAVVAAIRIGFRRLSTNAQKVLIAAAVLDDRVATELLAKATGFDLADVNTSLDELEWQRWVVAEPRGYVFVARIVREVIARDMLTPGQRKRILSAVDGNP